MIKKIKQKDYNWKRICYCLYLRKTFFNKVSNKEPAKIIVLKHTIYILNTTCQSTAVAKHILRHFFSKWCSVTNMLEFLVCPYCCKSTITLQHRTISRLCNNRKEMNKMNIKLYRQSTNVRKLSYFAVVSPFIENELSMNERWDELNRSLKYSKTEPSQWF